MPRDDVTNYVELKVGRYRLALSAEWVLGIAGEVAVSRDLVHGGCAVPFLPLHELFWRTRPTAVPFAVVVGSGTPQVAVSADGVNHLRFQATTPLLPVPPFGLEAPELFLGALRHPDGLLLVLDPNALCALVARPPFAV